MTTKKSDKINNTKELEEHKREAEESTSVATNSQSNRPRRYIKRMRTERNATLELKNSFEALTDVEMAEEVEEKKEEEQPKEIQMNAQKRKNSAYYNNRKREMDPNKQGTR